jgi:DNA-binding beta-propeller fold protein YncE
MNFHGVYRIPPGGGEIQLLVDNLNYPNGIVFSPDETKLYINDSNGRHVYVYDVIDDSTLANATLFANTGGNQHADGMEVDSSGNLYVAGSSGLAIFSPDGTLLDEISVPGITSNVKWGGENGSILFITSFTALYGIDTIVTSIEDDLVNNPIQFQLDQNYPNPFNPTTKIRYSISQTSNVIIKVFDILGNEIATLVNEEKLIGNYEVEFNATNLPSGIYFYHLRAGDPSTGSGQSFVETKKMVLMK